MGDDPYKQYNEALKVFDTLAKRESELLQKISQADSEKDIASKFEWAKELKDRSSSARRSDSGGRRLG